jgi:hypothetical protein
MNAFVSATSIFDRRFLKNAFLPTLLLPVAVITPWVLQESRLAVLAARWQHQALGMRVIEALLYLALTWFIASIVASQWRNIIRLFEGYPLKRIAWINERCTKYYRARAEQLQQRDDHRTFYYNFPNSSDDILPTRLGNTLIAAERYSFDRHGADPIVLWPRLYHLLPREFVDDVEDARAALEFLLVISLWFVIAGTGSLTLLTVTHAAFGLAVLVLALSALGAYAFYLSGIRAATEYAEQMRSGVELYRLQLLEWMKIKKPRNLAEELESWDRLLDMVVNNATDPDIDYVYPEPQGVVVRLPDLFPGGDAAP